MARLKSGIFGPISGKLGPIVGATWKGIPYLREASKKRNPVRTAAQLANEGKFKFVNDWLVPFHPYLNIGFQNQAVGKTAISAALSANYRTVFSGIYPAVQIAYPELRISSGQLSSIGEAQVTLIGPDRMELSWTQNYGPGAAYNDQIMLVLYSETLGITDGFVGAAVRAAEQCTFTINPRLIGQSLHGYLSVVSMDRQRISDSLYLGKIDTL